MLKDITKEFKVIKEENVQLPRYEVCVRVEVPDDEWGNEYNHTKTYGKEEFENDQFLAIVISYIKKYNYEDLSDFGTTGRLLREWLYNNDFFMNSEDTTLCDLDIWYFDEENRRYKVEIPKLDDYFDDPNSWEVSWDDDEDDDEPEETEFQREFKEELEKQNSEF